MSRMMRRVMRKMLRRMVASVLSISMFVGIVSIGTGSVLTTPLFTDIDSHWAKSGIEQAVSKGYVSGYPDGTFQPNKQVTRAEFIKMVVDGLKLPHSLEGSPWYQPYVAAAIDFGIHNESDFNSDYNKALSRLELVKLAVRAIDVRYQTKKVEEDTNFMVYEATQKGLLHGTGVGDLDLTGTSTRAQAVAIIERILAIHSGQTLPVDKYAVASAELLWHRTNIFTTMPDYFDVNKNPEYGSWNVKNLTLKNDNYSGEITEMLAINLGDPKDPNRKLLPALDKMQFDYGYLNPMPADAYVLIVKYHENYNKKPTTYAGGLGLDIRGTSIPEDAVEARKLVTTSGFRSLDPKFEHLNKVKIDKDGNGLIVFVLPGSGYTFKDPSMAFSVYAAMYPGSPLGDILRKSVLLARVK